MNWLTQNAELLWCIAGCMLVTLIPRIVPVMFLKTEKLPPLLRHWLSFVPVSVMAALLSAQIFFYEDRFNPGPSNLYLVAAIPSLLVAWKTRSFFGTILFAMLFVAGMRYFGWY
ncbi:AzlD domain-containing protein [uncultured Desulfovibrio sp.]|uniref:AzlD domain-containing protein n=1 Tax=uncultured Desulfovibrio sp. TaxID=167968 RepID=UPI00262E0EFE|nr:AzlD domain-containing protein [uncultured Desulfovibrio sp.]